MFIRQICPLYCYYAIWIVITNFIKKLICACACNIFFKNVSQASVDLIVHYRVHILITGCTVKENATVVMTCVMYPQDVKMFLQVIRFSISQKYADEQLFSWTLRWNNTWCIFFKINCSLKSNFNGIRSEILHSLVLIVSIL